MTNIDLSIVQQLVAEEIRRVVGEAIQNSECLSIGRSAALIHKTYPNCGMTAAAIAAEMLEAAVAARIPIEMSRPEVLAV